MEEGLKKRLVGAAVLASLAIIFVPMLVEEPVDKAQLLPAPPPPKARPFDSQLLREEVSSPVPAVQPTHRKKPEPVSESPTGSVSKEQKSTLRTGLSTWVVQVGSFSSEENARKLVAKLRKAHFQTRDVEQIEIRGKVLYRVRVGPVLEKKRALALLPKVNRISGTKGSVRTYP